MKDEMRELKTQILEKNKILNSAGTSVNDDNRRVRDAKKELDRLLYKYYKLLKCRGGGALLSRRAF